MHTMQKQNRQGSLYALLGCIVVLAATALSFLPEADKNALHTRGRFHWVGHLLVFGLVAYLMGRVSRSWWTRGLLFLFTLSFGFGIEVAEHLLYGTSLEWSDIVVDGVGVVGGTLIAFFSVTEAESNTVTATVDRV